MTATVPVILLGAGGHARVVLDLLHLLNCSLLGVCDPALAERSIGEWQGIPVLGDDTVIDSYSRDEILLANGLGSLPGNYSRKKIHEHFTAKGYKFITLIHPKATVAADVELGSGVQIMAGCVVQAGTRIGENTLINTAASVDHDCGLGKHIHVGPGSTLCGGVIVEDDCYLGSGCVVIQNLMLGRGSLLGAGTCLVQNLPMGHRKVGTASIRPSEG